MFVNRRLLAAWSVVTLACVCRGQQRCTSSNDRCITLETCPGLYSRLQLSQNSSLTHLQHCGFENQKPKVCCSPDHLVSRLGEADGKGFQTGNYGPGPANSSDRTRRAAAGKPVSGANLLPDSSQCGVDLKKRTAGGTTCDLDEYPWMALLEYDKFGGPGFFCGGVLISSRYILTAAHCVKGKDIPASWRLSRVRLGEYNVSSIKDCVGRDCSSTPLNVAVQQAIVYGGYDPNDKHQQHDIALLRLAQPVSFTAFVKPICLPVSQQLRRHTFVGSKMVVAGWGKTETRAESDVKLQVSVPVLPNAECARVYSRLGRVIGTGQMCAGGGEGRDSCRGDSGGALMGRYSDASNWLAVGVASYGPSPCGTAGWPGVYTLVGHYIDWILASMRL